MDLQVAYNATYLQNNLALQFSAEPEWLLAENMQGTVYNGNSIAVLLNFITEGLDSGDYSMDMVITSNDPASFRNYCSDCNEDNKHSSC